MELENRITDKELLSSFDVGHVSIDALLFQCRTLAAMPIVGMRYPCSIPEKPENRMPPVGMTARTGNQQE